MVCKWPAHGLKDCVAKARPRENAVNGDVSFCHAEMRKHTHTRLPRHTQPHHPCDNCANPPHIPGGRDCGYDCANPPHLSTGREPGHDCANPPKPFTPPCRQRPSPQPSAAASSLWQHHAAIGSVMQPMASRLFPPQRGYRGTTSVAVRSQNLHNTHAHGHGCEQGPCVGLGRDPHPASPVWASAARMMWVGVPADPMTKLGRSNVLHVVVLPPAKATVCP